MRKKQLHRTHRNYRRGADDGTTTLRCARSAQRVRDVPSERRAKLDLLKPPSTAHPIFRLGAHSVIRAAGSKGEWDLAAQCAHNDLWLQVKSAPDLKRGMRELNKLGRWLARYAKPVPSQRYLAGLVWVPRVGWLVAARYSPDKVVLSENAYPSNSEK